MGEVHAELTIKNLFGKKTTRIKALVDTGASWMIVTPEVAKQLGYDPEEMRTMNTTLADGRRVPVPVIGPLEVGFHPDSSAPADRTCQLQAIVLGTECLLGQVPLEMMDLMIDPLNRRVMGRHPDGPQVRV